MSRQSEIQEGTYKYLLKNTQEGGYLNNWAEFSKLLSLEQQEDYIKILARGILSYLDSEGVVIGGSMHQTFGDGKTPDLISYEPLVEETLSAKSS